MTSSAAVNENFIHIKRIVETSKIRGNFIWNSKHSLKISESNHGERHTPYDNKNPNQLKPEKTWLKYRIFKQVNTKKTK